tara:strand:+ start:19 stop:630 length:612 start_codon:yes stop_codon:yes gene_type:complete
MKLLFKLSIFFFLALNSLVWGRIGEDRLAFEQRLNVSGGYQYREESVLSNRKRGMPYLKYLDFLPSRSELRIYYKTLDGRKPLAKEIKVSSMLEGWDIHVIFVEGKSVFEIYRRSSKINEFEFSALLRIQTENSFWEKASEIQDQDAPETAFGFDYMRNDKKLRAKRMGSSSLLFLSTQFDKFLNQEFKKEQMEALPLSIKGF